jgi:hypothetical protein
MKGIFSWFIGLVVQVKDIFVLPWLLWLAEYKIFFPTRTLFQLIYPRGPLRDVVYLG